MVIINNPLSLAKANFFFIGTKKITSGKSGPFTDGKPIQNWEKKTGPF